MRSLRPQSMREWLILAACTAMLSTVPVALTPGAAAATVLDRVCDCEGTYCQDTGGSPYQRWCCSTDEEECGCTFFVMC